MCAKSTELVFIPVLLTDIFCKDSIHFYLLYVGYVYFCIFYEGIKIIKANCHQHVSSYYMYIFTHHQKFMTDIHSVSYIYYKFSGVCPWVMSVVYEVNTSGGFPTLIFSRSY